MAEQDRVVVAMSGGVDSSVAAALLVDQGYEVIGVTMKVWPSFLPGGGAEGGCCTLEAVEDARTVASRLGIPYYVLNFSETFTERVIEPFCQGYLAARTPNPCLLCNRDVKWDGLLRKARELGAGYLATGHYARRGYDPVGQRQTLSRGVDEGKDQSYVLYCLTQEQLAMTLFPLGGLRKTEVRRLAAERGLPVADKGESQEICFIPDHDYRGFLKAHAPAAVQSGPIIDLAGRELGRHEGLAFYTVGQRKGLRLTGGPYYVVRLDKTRNAVVVGRRAELGRREFTAEDVTWVSIAPPAEPLTVTAKVRYRVPAAGAVVSPAGAGRVSVRFDAPQFAVTPGQAAVFYHDDLVLGGGTISADE